MSDNDAANQQTEKPFCVDVAKYGRAACKKCKEKCLQNQLRIAKLMSNPFGSDKMKAWHHVDCMFEQFLKQRPTTARIDTTDCIDGWEDLDEDNKQLILEKIDECNKWFEEKHGVKPPTPVASPKDRKAQLNNSCDKKVAKDHMFREFRKLVNEIAEESSYLEKTKIVKRLFNEGCDGKGFKGDKFLWCKLLLPGVVTRIYNLQSKQLVKLFSSLLKTDNDKMLTHLEQGDVGDTIEEFFENSRAVKPAKKSTLTLEEVDEFLEKLSSLTKEDEQKSHFKSILAKCTAHDLKMIIRLIKHDLRMTAGAKHILDAIHPDAYTMYQASRDLGAVIEKCQNHTKKSSMKATISLFTPILPMLAEACKSIEQAFKRCPNGLFAEIKYDGERVQVHKRGTEFRYFSRSLKPVLPHKVAHFKKFIPQAFPHGKDLILDTEILMMDTHTGKPLPFGTLGIHKKSEFKDATVCLFVFDCIYYNGDVLINKPIKHRKKILNETMIEIPNHIVFSEMKEIHQTDDLSAMIAKVLKLGLEGLVLKDLESTYEPGKRHWLKVKKDYLFDGAMADSADLIVLGAWYGTGKKGGMMSVFLMGCYDSDRDKYVTVTKVHTGHDDETLEKLQNELDMIKISCDPDKIPGWLHCNKPMIPDFVAKNPKEQPVWEITGAEFTQHEVHTADGISIRFPRVTRIRDDKSWESATTLDELKKLVKASKESIDVSLLTNKTTNKRLNDNVAEPSTSKMAKLESVADVFRNKIRKPLPDFFSDIKLVLDKELEEKASKWIRYFIAYGGKLLGSEKNLGATHHVHSNVSAAGNNVDKHINIRHVTLEWLIHSICNGCVQNTKPYAVEWKITTENSI